VPLADGITDQGILRLQVEDVELVDAGRHQQKGLFIDLGGERLVFDQLEKFVFIDHGALGGGHVLAHLEQALVGHRDMALLHVVHQVLDAFGDALALGVDGFLLGLGVERQEVARGGRGHPLLHRKTDAAAGFGVGVHRVGQAHQGAGVEQVGGGIESRHRVVGPGLSRKTTVLDLKAVLQALVPQVSGILEILALQGLQFFRRKFDRQRHVLAWFQSPKIDGLKMLHGIAPAFCEFVVKVIAHAGPKFRGSTAHAGGS